MLRTSKPVRQRRDDRLDNDNNNNSDKMYSNNDHDKDRSKKPQTMARQQQQRKRFLLFQRAQPPVVVMESFDDDDDDDDSDSVYETDMVDIDNVAQRQQQRQEEENEQLLSSKLDETVAKLYRHMPSSSLSSSSAEDGVDDEDENDDDAYSSGSSDTSGSSLSTMAELRQQVLLQRAVSSTSSSSSLSQPQRRRLMMMMIKNKASTNPQDTPQQLREKEQQLQQYMAKRHMTATQEKWNAITILPNPIYCLYFLLSGIWIRTDILLQPELNDGIGSSSITYYNDNNYNNNIADNTETVSGFGGFANYAVGDVHGCLSGQGWLGFTHHMYALPPLPVMAVAFGILCHAPFSFLYHWKYAYALGASTQRLTHWSRRMDQAMIHFASACMSYATSGSWDFFVANVLFNADCIYRQLFQRAVKPRRNQVRLLMSILAYTMPILRRGDWHVLLPLYATFGVSGWLFLFYPIGGWSHTAFHLVIALAPPLLMMAATELPRSQDQMRLAAMCAAASAWTTTTTHQPPPPA